MDREREEALVARLKQGDTAAFDAIYDTYRPRVFAFLLRMGRRRALAEDLSQEVWLRLARSARHLDPDTRLRPWLFTVARNLLVSHLRWRALDAASLDALAFESAERTTDTPEQVAAARESAARLEAALGALPGDQREAVLLVAVERLSPAEAAAVVGVKPDALRQRLSRARAALGRALEPAPERRSI